MKKKPILYKKLVRPFLNIFSMVFIAGTSFAWAQTPADENFTGASPSTPATSATINDLNFTANTSTGFNAAADGVADTPLDDGDNAFFVNITSTTSSFKSLVISNAVSPGSEFSIVSFELGTSGGGTNNITLEGFRDGVSVASDAIDLSSSDASGSVNYTVISNRSGTVTFNTGSDPDWENIDEIKISSVDPMILVMDTFDFSAAASGNAPPTASNVSFSGTLEVGEQLSGTYTYADVENDTESGSTYQWYRSDDGSGTNKAAITGATSQTYTLATGDEGKHISFEVTPNDGTDAGTPVESPLQGPVAISDAITYIEVFKDGVDGVDGLASSSDPVVSPDGKHVYVAAVSDFGIGIFSRDQADGTLTYVDVIKDGTNGANNLAFTFGVDISADGKNVYAVSPADDAITVFSRNDTTGALTFVEDLGTSVASGMDGPVSVTVSPDDKSVYVVSGSTDGLVVFSRDASTGQLTFVEQHLDGVNGNLLGQAFNASSSPINNIAVTSDGGFLYVTSTDDSAVSVYTRNVSTGALTLASSVQNGVGGITDMLSPASLVLSPDNEHIYVSAQNGNSLLAFSRNSTTGELTFLEKHKEGVNGITTLQGIRSLATSPDGRFVYASALSDDAITVFNRNTTNGMLTIETARIDGVNTTDGLDGVSGMVTDPLSLNLYASGQSDNALAVFSLPIPGIVLTATTASANENGTAVILDDALSVFDADDTELTSGTVTISSGFLTGDILSVTTQGGIGASYNSTNGVLTLTGNASLTDYQATLRTLTYQAGDDPGITDGETATRTVQLKVSDGTNESAASEIEITVNGQSLPIVTSIVRQSPTDSLTNASSVTFRVTFDKDVTNISAADFTISGAGAGGTAAISGFSTQTADSVFDLTISNINTDGELDLDFAGGQDITDTGGNAFAGTINSEEVYSIDQTAPTISITTPIEGDDAVTASEDNDVTIGGTTSGAEDGQTVTVAFNDGANPTVQVSGTVSSNDWTATDADISGLDEGNITVTADVSDLAGNSATQASETILLDRTAPTISSVTSSTANGTYNAGDIIAIQVIFNEAVVVTGTPQLTLETGGVDQVVDYSSGSGTDTLNFSYTVQTGDVSTDLDYTNASALSAGTSIRDNAGNDATLTLPTPGASGSLGANKALVIDGEPTVTLSVDNSSIAEASGTATLTATLSAISTTDVTVTIGYSGTAVNGTDYNNTASTSIVVSAGQVSADAAVIITATQDADSEGNETIIAEITGVTNGSEDGTQSETITIIDDDAVQFSVNDTSVTEGNSGTAILTFTVSLNNAATSTVTVDYALSDGTATTADNDYINTSGTITFNSGESSKTVDVTVTGDEKVESDEVLILTLSNNTGLSFIADTTGTATIANDDQAVVTIADVAASEGDGTAILTLVADKAVDGGFAVDVSTGDSTATIADNDYTALSSETITFTGSAGEIKQISVTLGSDAKVEAGEIVKLAMSGLNPVKVAPGDIDVTDGALLTITNDDQAMLTIADVTGNEDDGAIAVTATLDNPVDGGFTVDVSTADSSATIANNDYTALVNETLTFTGTSGETRQFTVTPVADEAVENDEIVALVFSNLSTALNVDITNQGFVTITNDDNAPTFSSEDSVDVAENQISVTTVTASDLDSGMSITYSISGGDDEALFNIDSNSGELTFKAAPDFENPTDSDTDNEYKVTVQATDGTNQVSQDMVITVTDTDDIAPVFTSLDEFSVQENETTIATVTATDGDAISTVTFEISDGVDSTFLDINSQTGVLTFEQGADYETPLDSDNNNKYQVQITATDGTNSTTQEVTVTVTDVNEFSPVFSSVEEITLEENTSEVLTVTAADADTADTITYSVSGGADASLFSIGSSTGVLTFISAPDFEAPADGGANNIYNLEVTASDGSNNTSQQLTITITDVNEFTPVITSSSSAFVYESMNVGTVVTTVTSSDEDGNSEVSYSISSNVNPNGNGTETFSIDASSGVITLADPGDLDKDTTPELMIEVTANDGLFDATQTITIAVLTPPVAESFIPVNGAEDVALSGTVSVTFDQNVQVVDLSGITITDENSVSISGITSGLTDSTVNITYQGLENLTQYTVTIPAGAVENADGIGNLEAQWQFTTIIEVPAKVVLIAPINSDGSVPVNPAFAWESIERAESAIFQITTDSLFSSDVTELSGFTTTQLTLTSALEYYQTYYWRVRGVNKAAAGPWSETGVFITEAEVPGLIFPADEATDISTAPNIQWNSPHTETLYQFQSAAEGTFQNVLTDQTIAQTNIQLNALAAETEYFWRVRVNDEVTSSEWSEVRSFTTRPDPAVIEDDPVVVNISFGDTTSSGQQTDREVVQTDYRMVGLPGTDRIRLDDFFEGPYKKSWRAFIETGDDLEFYDEYTPEDDRFVFMPGLGFWVLSTEIVAGQYTFTGVETDENDSYRITMHPGWNIIANPYQSPVEWELVREFNDITGELYGYEEEFLIADTMEVLKGYYYYNAPELNMDTLYIPYTGFDQRGIEDEDNTISTKNVPRLLVEAKLNNGIKHDIEILYSDTLQQYQRQLKSHHPDLEFARTGMVMSKEKESREKLSRSLSIYTPEGEEFLLEIKGKVGSNITWTPDFRKLPDEAAILLINDITLESRVLKNGEEFKIRISEPISRFKLFVGDYSYLQEFEETLIPDQVVLNQNYPNPFNPATTINYALTKDANVRLEVYDILGRLITTLVNDKQKAGWHKVRFDGSAFSSGVYFYRLHAGKDFKLGKMTLIK
ncbi:MAG: cadherin domain-containing protein [Balneola sp.]